MIWECFISPAGVFVFLPLHATIVAREHARALTAVGSAHGHHAHCLTTGAWSRGTARCFCLPWSAGDGAGDAGRDDDPRDRDSRPGRWALAPVVRRRGGDSQGVPGLPPLVPA